MGIPNHGIATSEADYLLLASRREVFAGRSSTAQALAHSVVPILGIRRPAAVGRLVGSRRLHGLLVLLRNSEITQVNYNRSAQLWKEGFFKDATIFSNDWVAWRALTGRFDMDDFDPLRNWAPPPAAQRCANQGDSDPLMSGKYSQAQLNTRLADEDVVSPDRLLWRTPSRRKMLIANPLWAKLGKRRFGRPDSFAVLTTLLPAGVSDATL